MNTQVAARMLWKDYRTLRSFWVALILGTIVVQLLLAWYMVMLQNGQVSATTLAFVGLVATGLYAVGCGAALFAYEHEDGTRNWLQQLPLHTEQLFWPKIAWGFISSLLLSAVVILTGMAIGYGCGDARIVETWSPVVTRTIAIVVGILGSFTCALFWSLMTRRTLLAAVLTLPSAALVMVIATQLVAFALFGKSPDAPMNSAQRLQLTQWVAVCHGVLAIGLMLINRRMAAHWLVDAPPGRARSVPFTRWVVAPDASTPGNRYERNAMRVLGRLLWLHWRQTRGVSSVLLAVAVLGPWVQLIAQNFGTGIPLPLQVVAAVTWGTVMLAFYGLPMLIGVNTFSADQLGAAFRFLTQHGVDPGRVWTSRQLAGLALLAMSAALCLFCSLPLLITMGRLPNLNSYEYWTLIYAATLGVALAYAAGQFGSLFFRSTLVGLFVSFLITLGLWCWMALIWRLQIPWWWSVLPLGVALLVATRRRTAAWLMESPSIWQWVRPASLPVIVWLLILAGVAVYRVYEIPRSGIDITWHQLTQSLDEKAALETAQLYRAAAAALSSPPPPGPPDDSDEAENAAPSTAWPCQLVPPTEAEQAWVEKNDQVLSQFRAAAARPGCLLHPESEGVHAAPGEVAQLRPLAELVFVHARIQVADGELASAWRDFLNLLQFAHHVRNLGTLQEWQWGHELERRVYSLTVPWASAPGQTSELLTTAISQLVEVPSQRPRIANNLQRHHADALQSGGTAMERTFVKTRWQAWLLRWVPTEQARARRLYSLLVEDDLLQIRSIENSWRLSDQEHSRYDNHRTAWVLARAKRDGLALGFSRETYKTVHALTENQRRALVVGLLLARHELKTGELPWHVVELPIDADIRPPVDWYTGQPFVYLRHGIATDMEIRSFDVVGQVQLQTYPRETPLLWSPADWRGSFPHEIRELLELQHKDRAAEAAESSSPTAVLGRDGSSSQSATDRSEREAADFDTGIEYGGEQGHDEFAVDVSLFGLPGAMQPLSPEERLNQLRAAATVWQSGIVYPVPHRTAATESK